MNTAVVSTFKPLPGQTAGAAISLVLNNDGKAPVLYQVRGYMNGTASTQYWLQFFNAAVAPAANTKPVWEEQVIGQDGFGFDYSQKGLDFLVISPAGVGGQGVGNLICCVSTTSGVFTAATTQTMDLEVEMESDGYRVLGQSVIGDLTTAVQTLQVWANASGYQHLYRIDATSSYGGGTTTYLQLHTVDAPSAGAIPLLYWPVADTATIKKTFGDSGLVPWTQVLNAGAAATINKGCSLFVSTTANTYTAAAGTPYTIRAFYKAT
jgi:hypothetical protein